MLILGKKIKAYFETKLHLPMACNVTVKTLKPGFSESRKNNNPNPDLLSKGRRRYPLQETFDGIF